MDMEFHLIKKEAITDEDILEEMKSVMKKLGKSKLTIKEFDANARINSSTVTRRFGKWNNALALAGADISNTFYSDEELLSNIKDAWLKKGKQPSRRDMDNKELSMISSGTYLRHYGTWYKALESFIAYVSENDDSLKMKSLSEKENIVIEGLIALDKDYYNNKVMESNNMDLELEENDVFENLYDINEKKITKEEIENMRMIFYYKYYHI